MNNALKIVSLIGSGIAIWVISFSKLKFLTIIALLTAIALAMNVFVLK